MLFYISQNPTTSIFAGLYYIAGPDFNRGTFSCELCLVTIVRFFTYDSSVRLS